MDETKSLNVGEGECLVLSPESPRFKDLYTQVRPRTADEVKALLGLSPETEKAAREQGVCCAHAAAPAATVPAEDLDHQDAAVRTQARTLTYQAFNAYVHGTNSGTLAQMKPAFSRFLDITKAVINVARLQDIEVADGATLTISKNTHLVQANKVIIHRTGRIVCHGSTKFKIASLEGVRPRLSVGTVASASISSLAHK